MVSWVKPSVILLAAMVLILFVATLFDWPATLLVPGCIIAVLAALFGHTDNSRSFRRSAGFEFLGVSAIVFLVSCIISNMVRQGIRTVLVGILTGDGPAATGSELAIFYTLAAEILLCIFMVRHMPSTMTDDGHAVHVKRITTA